MPERDQSADLEFIVLMAISNALNREPAFRPGPINIRNVARAALEPVQAEMDRLNGQIAEWSKANLAIVAKCVDLEREVAQWVKNSAVSQRRIEHLERQIEELSAAVPNRKDPPG